MSRPRKSLFDRTSRSGSRSRNGHLQSVQDVPVKSKGASVALAGNRCSVCLTVAGQCLLGIDPPETLSVLDSRHSVTKPNGHRSMGVEFPGLLKRINEHLVEVQCATRLASSCFHPVSKTLGKLGASASDRLVRHGQTALEEHFLDVAQA